MARIFFVILFFLLTGCAHTLPEMAFKDPVQAISIPDAVTLEKQGIKSLTMVLVKFNPGLLVEDSGVGGMWPLETRKPSGEIVKGFIFGNFASNQDEFGNFLFPGIIYASLGELQEAKSLYFSRLGQKCFSLSGKKIEDYRPDKYLDDEELFQKHGMTFVALDEFWKQYLEENFKSPPAGFTCVRAMTLEEYKDLLDRSMKSFPKMPDGEIRATLLDMENFRGPAVENPEITAGEKFWGNFNLGIPYSPESLAWMLGGGTLNGLIAVGRDGNKGYYLSADVKRGDLSWLAERLCRIYTEKLKNQEIAHRQKIKLLLETLLKNGVKEEQIRKILPLIQK